MKKPFVLLTSLLSGCAGIYQQTNINQPHAVLVSEFSENDLIQGGTQLFYAYDNDSCQANYGAAITALRNTERTKATRIPSNNEIYIQVATFGITDKLYACNTGFCNQTEKCASLISFIPKEGETYTIKHNYINKVCTISLTNNKTKRTPESMKSHSIKSNCKI